MGGKQILSNDTWSCKLHRESVVDNRRSLLPQVKDRHYRSHALQHRRTLFNDSSDSKTTVIHRLSVFHSDCLLPNTGTFKPNKWFTTNFPISRLNEFLLQFFKSSDTQAEYYYVYHVPALARYIQPWVRYAMKIHVIQTTHLCSSAHCKTLPLPFFKRVKRLTWKRLHFQ